MQLLVFLCSEDDEPICSKLCCEHIGLLEVLGSYLQSYTEHESKIIETIIFTLSNIAAESNTILKHKVLQRSNLVDFFDCMLTGLTPEMAAILPWTLVNLFTGGMTHILDSE